MRYLKALSLPLGVLGVWIASIFLIPLDGWIAWTRVGVGVVVGFVIGRWIGKRLEAVRGYRQGTQDAHDRAGGESGSQHHTHISITGPYGQPIALHSGGTIAAEGTGEDTSVVVPDSSAPIIAWRAWLVTAEGFLQALNQGTTWPAKEHLEAQCNGMMGARSASAFLEEPLRHVDPCPVETCACGIYAHKDATKVARDRSPWSIVALAAASIGRSDFDSKVSSTVVFGTVALWGKVIEADSGYRAQRAYPQQLYVELPEKPEVAAFLTVSVIAVYAHRSAMRIEFIPDEANEEVSFR